MAIELRFVTALIRKDGIENHFAGGLTGFRKAYPDSIEDDDLVAIRSMSGGELEETLGEIFASAPGLADCCAVGDMYAGPLTHAEGIAFGQSEGASGELAWLARLTG